VAAFEPSDMQGWPVPSPARVQNPPKPGDVGREPRESPKAWEGLS
jgi:hypothetical protein